MKTISTLKELNIPPKHQRFISEFLRQAKEIKTFDKIDAFILFGSCARGDAHEKSDVDILAIGDGIGDETLFDLYDCEYYPGFNEKENQVNSDVFVNDRRFFDDQKQIVGSFQWRVYRDGVNLNGLLQYSGVIYADYNTGTPAGGGRQRSYQCKNHDRQD